jgi:hypothetical protein
MATNLTSGSMTLWEIHEMNEKIKSRQNGENWIVVEDILESEEDNFVILKTKDHTAYNLFELKFDLNILEQVSKDSWVYGSDYKIKFADQNRYCKKYQYVIKLFEDHDLVKNQYISSENPIILYKSYVDNFKKQHMDAKKGEE